MRKSANCGLYNTVYRKNKWNFYLWNQSVRNSSRMRVNYVTPRDLLDKELQKKALTAWFMQPSTHPSHHEHAILWKTIFILVTTTFYLYFLLSLHFSLLFNYFCFPESFTSGKPALITHKNAQNSTDLLDPLGLNPGPIPPLNTPHTIFAFKSYLTKY